MSPTAPHPRRPRSDPQASHSTCGDTPADSDAEPLPGTGERAADDAAAVDVPAAPAAPDDFGESFGDSGDGPDACAPPAGDAGPPDGPAGGALGVPGAGALGGDDG